MKKLVSLFILPFLLASCSVLEPVEDFSVLHLLNPTVPERQVTGSSPRIALSSPSLPGYLDRQQLVSRTGVGELEMNPNHLWAEPLEAGISRVTATNLSRLTNSLNIQPVDNFVTLDYESLLEIRIERFEPDPQNNLILRATWKLQPVDGPVAQTRLFTTSVPIPIVPEEVRATTEAGPMAGRIQAMDVALARLARQIAGSL